MLHNTAAQFYDPTYRYLGKEVEVLYEQMCHYALQIDKTKYFILMEDFISKIDKKKAK